MASRVQVHNWPTKPELCISVLIVIQARLKAVLRRRTKSFHNITLKKDSWTVSSFPAKAASWNACSTSTMSPHSGLQKHGFHPCLVLPTEVTSSQTPGITRVARPVGIAGSLSYHICQWQNFCGPWWADLCPAGDKPWACLLSCLPSTSAWHRVGPRELYKEFMLTVWVQLWFFINNGLHCSWIIFGCSLAQCVWIMLLGHHPPSHS